MLQALDPWRWRGWALVQEAGVAIAEAVAVVAYGGWGHGRVAEAGMVVEGGWAAFGDVAPGSLEAVMHSLLEHGSG